jgi:hypothetical protein
MLAHGEWTSLIGAAGGVLGALAVVAITRARMVRRRVPVAALTAPEPALNG